MNEKASAAGNGGITPEGMQKNKKRKDESQATCGWVASFLSERLKGGKAATSRPDKNKALCSGAAKSAQASPGQLRPARSAFLKWCVEGSEVASRLRWHGLTHLAVSRGCGQRHECSTCVLSALGDGPTPSCRLQAANQSLHAMETSHPCPRGVCTPLFKKTTSQLSLHCPFSVLTVLDTRARMCFRDTELVEMAQLRERAASEGLPALAPPRALTFFAPCSSSTPSPITTYTTFLPNL